MKSHYRYFIILGFAVAIAGIFTRCSEDEGGKPLISYIRVTRPDASDSLLVAAGQGQMIAIIGENLQGVRELWVNDQRATLIPTFITSKSIITRVPSQVPAEITNQMVLVFGDGTSLTHEFKLEISKPVLSYMSSEYVPEGEVAVIHGDFFYEPLTVTFSGGIQGEIVNVDDQIIKVKVPQGAQPGPITVNTNFGTGESDFWFADNRNVFGSFDGGTGGWWHGPNYIVSSDDDFPSVNNKFLRINQTLSNGQWFEFFVGQNAEDFGEATKNIPDDAIQNPEDYYLKFEIATIGSLAGAKIHIYIGNDMPGRRIADGYVWSPSIDTKGEWETVAIPFDQIIELSEPAVSDTGYGVSFWFWEGIPMDVNFAADNFRIVPKTLE